jgi:hypothetical protein
LIRTHEAVDKSLFLFDSDFFGPEILSSTKFGKVVSKTGFNESWGLLLS